MRYRKPKQWTASIEVTLNEFGERDGVDQPLVEYHLTVEGKLTAPTPPSWGYAGGDPGDNGDIEVTKVRLDGVKVYDPLCRDEGTDLVYGESYRKRTELWARNILYGESWVHDLLAEVELPTPDCD